MEERDQTAAGHPELRNKVVEQLQTVHALKSGALRMFGRCSRRCTSRRMNRRCPEFRICWRG
jgi:hypothetical protein